MFWAVALACLLAAGAAMTALIAVRAAHLDEMAALSAIVVRVTAPDEQAAVARAADVARTVPGVLRAEPMSAARAAALLSQFGPSPPTGPLPNVRLIEIDADPTADPSEDLAAAFRKAGIGAEMTRGAAPAAARAASAAVELNALVLAGLSIAAAAAATLLIGAARGAACAVGFAPALADLGATRGQVAGAIGGEAASAAFAAGVVAAAGIGAVLVGLRFNGPDAGIALVLAQLQPPEYAPLAAAPIGAAFLSWVGARSSAVGAYARAALAP
jgi:hypothetical protein